MSVFDTPAWTGYPTAAWRSEVPEGTSGAWSVRRFEVTPAAAKWGNLRAVVSGSGRFVPVGTYTGLYCGAEIIMSDTPDERRDHSEFMRHAHGKVLIGGLGLGCVLNVVAAKPAVTGITVVELSADVLKIVGPHFTERLGDRLELVHDDIRSWAPPRHIKWDCAWFDIWPNLCTDNLTEMGRLSRRFARRAEWRGSWGQDVLKARKRREAAAEGRRWGRWA